MAAHSRSPTPIPKSTLYFDERTNSVYEKKVNAKPGFGPAIAGSFADVALKHFCAKP